MGMPLASFLFTAPEPISSPLYIWRESAEIISPPNFFAKVMPKALFPLAVGPAIIIIFVLLTYSRYYPIV